MKPLKIEYSRSFFLVASKSGRVMDAKGAENGAQIQLWDKNGSESQRWVLETDGYIYQPGIRKSSRCGRKERGSKSSCWTRASPLQLWTFLADGNIVNPATGMAQWNHYPVVSAP